MKSLAEAACAFFDATSEYKRISKDEKLCLRKTLEKFLKSGDKEDAFSVYFCFAEIFRLFGGGYKNTAKLLELLSDHEQSAGGLLNKHRDHYSHSVYVFALGLAVYDGDENYRDKFDAFYKSEEDEKERFLFLWGITSLFHDIGYPFQLAHEQIKSYVAELYDGSEHSPYVSFGNFDKFVALDRRAGEAIGRELEAEDRFENLNELFAFGVSRRMGYDRNQVSFMLRERVLEQPDFMDHGYFSAVLFAKAFIERGNVQDFDAVLDALSAMLMHNSFCRYDAKRAFGKYRISDGAHPLAYLLVLCDELQNWDRTAFGKMSKKDPLAWTMELDCSKNNLSIDYYFDSFFVCAPQSDKRLNARVKELNDGSFVESVKDLLDSTLELRACAKESKKEKKHIYASDSSFVNLCDFAKAIHASYQQNCKALNIEYVNDSFAELPLEFKLSNIEQAKSYARKLELIDCFYSDRELDFPVVDSFADGKDGDKIMDFLCREEHVRWTREKLAMGWRYGISYLAEKDPQKRTQLRNFKKENKDIVPYEMLEEGERMKDRIMIDNIIPLLYRLGNQIRIYRGRSGRKPDLNIAGLGHRNVSGDRDRIKSRIKAILSEYARDFNVIVSTCFARGADMLIAECAAELEITLKAVLPMQPEKYIASIRKDALECNRTFDEEEETRLRHLLALTAVCKVVSDDKYTYFNASDYIIQRCDKLIAVWDGEATPLEDSSGNPINMGGTYHSIVVARQRGLKDVEDIHIVDCIR